MHRRRFTLLALLALLATGCNRHRSSGPSTDVSPSRSTVTVLGSTTVVADGVRTALIEIVLRNGAGAPLPDRTVTLAVSGMANTIVQPAPTDAAGRTTGTIASTLAEAKTVTATVAGVVELTQQPVLQFIGDAGDLDADGSTLVATPATVVADGVAVAAVTVTVRDRRGNPVPGQTVALAATGTDNSLVQPGLTSLAGLALGSLASVRAEGKTITATINPGADQITLTQSAAVTFIGDASNISASNSTVVATPASGLRADGATLATVTIGLVDRNGNALAGQSVQLDVSGAGNTITPPALTDVLGRTSGALATTRAEVKTVTATVNPGVGAVVLQQRPTVQFVWPLPDTYYVRSGGADVQDGRSPATAWQTLGRAATSVIANDTVWVGAGTYAEQLLVTTSDTRWRADGDGAMTGDAGDVVIDGGGGLDTVFLDGASNVVFEGFTITGATGVGSPAGGIRSTGNGNVLRGNRLWGNNNGIYVHGPTSWWNTGYGYRRLLTFGTAHDALPAGYTIALPIDTRVAATNVELANGDDVRVVWQPTGGAPVELDRRGNAFDSIATTLEFRLQTAIAANLDQASGGSYYVYYGNVAAGTAPASEGRVYWFADFFDRAAGTTIGNGWTEWTNAGDMEIAGGALVIKPTGDANPPQVGIKQTLPLGAIPGDFTVSLNWTMPANDEGIWSFWGVNVGTAATMVDSNRLTGVGVGLYNAESLGVTGIEAIDNDMSGALENGITGAHTFRLVVRRATFTYDYWRDGVLRSSGVAFANNQAVLDQVRIGADNFGFVSGQEQTIDNLKIVLDVGNGPEPLANAEEGRPSANGENTVIEGNVVSVNAGVGGDGIVVDNADGAIVRDNLVYNNQRYGVAVLGTATGVSLRSNTLYRNGAAQVRVDGAGNQVTPTDNIIADGFATGIEVAAGASVVGSDFNDVTGNALGNWSGLSPGASDISLDPLFEDPDGADGQLGGAGAADDRFQLRTAPSSPAFDAGSANATAVALADGTPFADRTTRLDGVLDGTAPNGPRLDLGRHAAALVATLPALGASELRLCYGAGVDRQPRVRTWRGVADDWSAAGAAVPAASVIRWVVYRASPAANGEELAAVLADAGAVTELDLLRWNGVAWSVDWTAGAIAPASAVQRPFDVAYEQSSGDAVAVFANETANPQFRVRAGGVWSLASSVFASPPGAATVASVVLASRPGSDALALVYADAAGALHAVLWNGSAWDEAGSKTTLSASLATVTESRAFDVAYEAGSGDLLVLWGHQYSSENVQFATRAAMGSSWSVQTLPALARAKVVRLAAAPDGDRIAAVLTEGVGDTDTVGMIWDGAAWTAITELDASSSADDRDAAVAWVGGSGNAVVLYKDDDGGGDIDWATWNEFTGWTVQPDVAVAGLGDVAFLAVATLSDGLQLVVTIADDNGALFGVVYATVVWVVTNAGNALQTGLSSTTTAPFGVTAGNR